MIASVERGDAQPDPSYAGWGLVKRSHETIACPGLAQELPTFTVHVRDGALDVVEVPGAALSGDLSSAQEIRFDEKVRITWCYPALEEPAREQVEGFFDGMLNVALFLRGAKCLGADQVIPPLADWWRLRELLGGFSDDDPAQHALIVNLAAELPPDLAEVAVHPSRRLMRSHDQERIAQIAQMDVHCMRDLARRPGTTVSEKAGPRQRLLAVKRQESLSTLENRVTRHCLELAQTACKRYLNSNGHHAASKRVESVRRFQRLSQYLFSRSSLADVPTLATPCRTPNHALLQNVHYAPVWSAYCGLVGNEDLRGNLWRWRQALWAELARMLIGVATLEWFQSAGFGVKQEAVRRLVTPRASWKGGQVLEDDCLPGPFVVGESKAELRTLHLVDRFGLPCLGRELAFAMRSGAQAVFVSCGSRGVSILPVFAWLAVQEELLRQPDGFTAFASEGLEHCRKTLQEVAGEVRVLPPILLAGWPGTGTKHEGASGDHSNVLLVAGSTNGWLRQASRLQSRLNEMVR